MTALKRVLHSLFSSKSSVRPAIPKPVARKVRLGVETLEDRVVPSWVGTPPSAVNLTAPSNDRYKSSFGSDGNFASTASITRNEIDYRTFVAQRSGTYTFEARANGSRIDTVAALFTSAGKRLAYNDDAKSGTNNSKFSATLVAGRTYVFGITNYQGGAKGAYKAIIVAPNLYSQATTGLDYIGSDGSATLRGTTLELTLSGHTYKSWYVTDHQIEVKMLNLNGQAIHNGSWVRGFRSAGAFVPGSPTDKYDTWTFDVSGFDLGKASQLWVQVSYF